MSTTHLCLIAAIGTNRSLGKEGKLLCIYRMILRILNTPPWGTPSSWVEKPSKAFQSHFQVGNM